MMSLGVALIWAIVSFFIVDLKVFTFSSSLSFFNYICCKCIVISLISLMIFSGAYWRKTDNDMLIKTAGLVLPIFLVYMGVALYFIFIAPRWYLVTAGDTGLIYNCALRLECYYDFHFLTSWFYIIALMICPHPMFVILFKILVFSFVIFWILYNTFKMLYGVERWKRVSITVIVYLFAFFFPFLLLITNCHRIYCYTPIMIFTLFELYRTYENCSEISIKKIIFLAFCVACVSQWRPEGIAILLAAIIILEVKIKDKNLANKMLLFAIFTLSNILVFIPQNLETFGGRQNYSDVRLHPLYSYRLTTMFYENSIDMNKYSEELSKIDKVISIDAIKKLNEDIKGNTYADGYIRWKEGYVGVSDSYKMDKYRAYVMGNVSGNTGFGSDEYEAYAESCKKIFKAEPFRYLKSCLNTFFYVEKMGMNEGNGDGHIPFIIIRLYYSIILAACINAIILIISLIKKYTFLSVYSICLFMQAGFVFVMAPGGYYKYYLPECFAVYLGVYIIIMEYLLRYNRKISGAIEL